MGRHPRALASVARHLCAGATAAEEDSHLGRNVMANTVIMPSIGLGCAYVASEDRSQDDITTEIVEAALVEGYRLFDTAQRYGTEKPLGEVLRRHFAKGTLRREDVFITTKTSNPRPGSGGMPAGGGFRCSQSRDIPAVANMNGNW